MSVLRIEGLHSLEGSIKIQGSKNGVLPVMAASLLHNGTTVLEHIPKIQDVFCMLGILNALGAECRLEGERLSISAASLSAAEIPETLAGQMRSSVMLLGPLLARLGRVETSLPGGCRIGKRPVDLHIRGLTELGAVVRIEDNRIRALSECGSHRKYFNGRGWGQGRDCTRRSSQRTGNRDSVQLSKGYGGFGGGSRKLRDPCPGHGEFPGFPLLPSRGPHCGRNISRRGSLCGWSCPSGASSGRAYGKDTLDGKTDGRAAGAGGRGHLGFHAETARPGGHRDRALPGVSNGYAVCRDGGSGSCGRNILHPGECI